MSDQSEVNRRRRSLVHSERLRGRCIRSRHGRPFAASMLPSERAEALGAPVEADIGQLKSRGKDDRRMARTTRLDPSPLQGNARRRQAGRRQSRRPKERAQERRVDARIRPERIPPIKPEYLVVVGICTHLGCSPQDRLKAGPEAFESQWTGGFYCPCHGSLFDLAGRVYKNKPAPDNLRVPPYMYLSDNRILIGEDKKGARANGCAQTKQALPERDPSTACSPGIDQRFPLMETWLASHRVLRGRISIFGITSAHSRSSCW